MDISNCVCGGKAGLEIENNNMLFVKCGRCDSSTGLCLSAKDAITTWNEIQANTSRKSKEIDPDEEFINIVEVRIEGAYNGAIVYKRDEKETIVDIVDVVKEWLEGMEEVEINIKTNSMTAEDYNNLKEFEGF
jgi:hypothetical protein